jgi:hypothetical protein
LAKRALTTGSVITPPECADFGYPLMTLATQLMKAHEDKPSAFSLVKDAKKFGPMAKHVTGWVAQFMALRGRSEKDREKALGSTLLEPQEVELWNKVEAWSKEGLTAKVTWNIPREVADIPLRIPGLRCAPAADAAA